MNSSFKDYFSTKSNEYASYRPTYPRRLAQELASLCVNTDVALDCGCGTGQLSVLLSEFFERVIAIDASSKQIENAEPCNGVIYRVATAENSQLPSASVDIVTVAQAAHWLELDKFYAEAMRVLKPNGVLALISYGILYINESTCDRIVQNFYYNAIGQYWPPERKHVESGYKTLPFLFQELQFPQLQVEANWNFDRLFGYITTWSAFKEMEKSAEVETIQKFKNELAAAWENCETKQKIVWPLSIRAGRVNN